MVASWKNNPGGPIPTLNGQSTVATQLAGGTVDQSAWDQQNAGKVDFSDPSVPAWVKYGFPDTPEGIAAYNNIYTAPPATTPAMPGGSVAPLPSSGYNGTDPFSQYLANNPGSGNAWAMIESLLKTYGLEGMNTWAENELQANKSGDQITLEMMNQQDFKDRFPVIDQLKQAGLPAWTPGDIVSFEKTATGLLQSAGLPPGFYDHPQNDIQQFILHGVSLAELNDRITNGYAAVSQMPQDVQEQWHALGFTTGDLVAHFLDPDTTEQLLTKQQAATQRAAEAKRAGYGQLSGSEALDLAGMGVTAAQSQQGFNQLTQEHELFGSLPGQAGQQDISRQQQLASVFDSNGPDQQAIQRVAAERHAAFTGGGQYTQSQNGGTGVGTAQ